MRRSRFRSAGGLPPLCHSLPLHFHLPLPPSTSYFASPSTRRREESRSEGPTGNSPGRKAGVGRVTLVSLLWRGPSGPHHRRGMGGVGFPVPRPHGRGYFLPALRALPLRPPGPRKASCALLLHPLPPNFPFPLDIARSPLYPYPQRPLPPRRGLPPMRTTVDLRALRFLAAPPALRPPERHSTRATRFTAMGSVDRHRYLMVAQ